MAIKWGAWEYSGGNGMRVGIDVSWENISHGESKATATVKYYTENQHSYSDNQTLDFRNAIGGSKNYFNGAGGGKVKRATKSYTYTYGSNEYGSSPGDRTFTVEVLGTYNGVTPQKSVTSSIPARPIAEPAPPTNASTSRFSDSRIDTSWTNNPTSGEPYEQLRTRIWDNVSNSWEPRVNLGKNATSYNYTGLSANRRYRVRIRAVNGAGGSPWEYSNYVQTTPASPSGCAVNESSTTSVTVSWSNGASTLNGYTYNTLIEESVDGGAFTQIHAASQTATSYSRTGLSPGSTYQYRVRARSTVGDTTYSSYSTSGTIQLLDNPAAPTGLSTTRNSDTSFDFGWTNNPTTDAPYDNLTLQRFTESVGTWETIATLGNTAINFNDINTVANNAYRWRIRANNEAGSSDWAYFTDHQTTPAAPSDVVGQLVTGPDIEVTWTNEVGYADYTVGVRYYKDGVLVDDTITLAAGETSYTLSNVDTLSNYDFGIKAMSDVGLSTESGWTASNNVSASAPPNAPTSLAPTGIILDLEKDQVFTWNHNPSADGSDQTAFEVQYSTDGGTNWTSTGQVTDTNEAWTMVADTLVNGDTVDWQVRTWGVDATASPWSSTATFNSSTAPTVTINDPSESILSVSQIDVAWSYFDAESTPQASWIVELLDDAGSLLERQDGNDTTSSITLETSAEDGKSYTIRVQAEDGDGLVSDWATLALAAEFTPPAVPDLAADYDPASGTTVVTLTPTDVVAPGTVDATNYAEDGSFETGTNGYTSNSDWDVETDSTHVHGGAQALKVTALTASPATVNRQFTLDPGTYTAATWVWIPASASFNLVTLRAGGDVDDPKSGPNVEATRDQWVRIVHTFTINSGNLTLYLYSTNPAIGDEIWWDDMIIVAGSEPVDYFDGDTERDDTYYYEWTGTPYASPLERKLIGTLDPTKVNLQRRLWNDEIGGWGPWVVIASDIAIDATLIDTTAPIAQDGEYRVVAFSAAPSVDTSDPTPPDGREDRWVYLSGGNNFTDVCRLEGNVSVRWTTTRKRALYQFAGRPKPVLFDGEASGRKVDVAGLLDNNSSHPAEWERLIKNGGVMFLRDPMGLRTYGSVEQIAIDYLGPELYAISFTLTEVDF